MTTAEIIDLIIKIGALATALTAIYLFAKKLISHFKEKDERINKMAEKLDVLVEHDQEQTLSILRLTIMNEEMPISERIIAGEKYVHLGGNGDVKHYYEKLIQDHTK